MLVGFLNADPTTKTVIFSQWTSFLNLLEPMLKREGIAFVRFDGKMSRKKRDAAVESFQRGQSHVFLASLKSACFGLNLTAANKVIMLDAWWFVTFPLTIRNPSVEDQATDRVYRLGQTRNVQVIRFVIKDSIEERVIASQEKKRELAASAFGNKKDRKKVKEARLADLKVFVTGFNQSRIFTTTPKSKLEDRR